MAEIIVASGPVIIEQDKVLLNRHGDDNLWKFPGGRVELDDFGEGNDELENACHREVGEEMGIKVDLLFPLKPMMVKRPDKPDSFVVLIHYLASRKGEIKPGEDIIEWNWFPLDQLPENCAPNVEPVLQQLEELKRSRLRL